MEANAIHELLVEKLGDAVVEFVDSYEKGSLIAAEKIAEAAIILRDEPELHFEQLMCLSGVDWDGYDEKGKGKSVKILGYDELGQPEQSDRVGEGDFGVFYACYSHRHGHKFSLFARVPRDVAAVPTVSHVWPTAAWHEREAFDLVGIKFEGHPDLRRILLEDEWDGHPLRKDYVMPSEWQGVPLQGQDYAKNPFNEADVVIPTRPGQEG